MGKKINITLGSKVILCISLVLIFSFLLYFFMTDAFPTNTVLKERDFYNQSFSNDENIVLIGSSHVGMLNVTHIEKKLRDDNQLYNVYNLAQKGDNPIKRIKTIDQIIQMNPNLVVYGVSYRDFNEEVKNPLPDPKEQFHHFLLQLNINENPKMWTLEKIRTINPELFALNKEISLDNTPFMTYDTARDMKVLTNEEIENYPLLEPKNINLNSADSNYQTSTLVKTINEFTKQNISVIVYITPIHEKYRNEIDITQKLIFDDIITRITNETEAEIFNLSDKYDTMQVWVDPAHLSLHSNSLPHNDDIVKIIKKEIEK